MRLAAITMQKNEEGLIDHWLSFYSALCEGYEHLHIFDDCSTSGPVRKSLEAAALKGANVYWNDNRKWKLEDKGRLVSQIVNDLGSKYDFYFPVDCDEFICLDDAGKPSFSRDAICAELERASASGHRVLRIETAFQNIPHSTDVYRGVTKKVVLCGSEVPVKLDTGFHLYDWWAKVDMVRPEEIAPSNIAHVHFQYRPYLMALEFAREKLKNRVPDFSRETIEKHTGGGFHLRPYFLISEDEYLGWFKHRTRIAIAPEFAKLGLDVPYSEPRPPLDQERLRQLLDPRNSAAKSAS